MKKILDLFVKIEDRDAKTPAAAPSANPQGTAQPTPQVVQATSVPSTGQEDSEIKKQLATALEQANQDGYDYFEFARALDSQAAILPAESLRFQATFAGASVMGVTTEKLISSAQYYLGILQNKEAEFSTAMEQHTGQSIISKEGDIKKIDADMVAKADQIRKITEEINTLQQQKTTLMNEISSSKSQVEQIKNNFYTTMKLFTTKIISDIEKIKTYLPK